MEHVSHLEAMRQHRKHQLEAWRTQAALERELSKHASPRPVWRTQLATLLHDLANRIDAHSPQPQRRPA